MDSESLCLICTSQSITERITQAKFNDTSEATFYPYRHHLFKKDEPARMQISSAVQEDEIFIMLIFLYSEVKRQDSQVILSSVHVPLTKNSFCLLL
jgi:hypothetical protein